MEKDAEESNNNIMGMDAVKGRWILIILGMILNLCLGTIYSWSVFVTPLTTYFTTQLGQVVNANECGQSINEKS